MIENFFIDGYAVFDDPKLIELVPEYTMPETNQFQMIDIDLQRATDYVGETYINPFFNDYDQDRYSMFVGAELTSMQWHNDLIEGHNVFFLYYLTDINQDGELMIMSNNNVVGSIQPKKHRLVMLSQAPHVLHKVNPTNQVRVAINFGYRVEGLNF